MLRWPIKRARSSRCASPLRVWQALLDKQRSKPTQRCIQAPNTSRWVLTPATAGNARRTVACGAPTVRPGSLCQVYILVNDYHEAVYLIPRHRRAMVRSLLDGRHRYTWTFPKDALPPVDCARGGFWSLTMYDKDYFMLPKSPNGRTNIGTVSLDANELKFAADGALTITISHEEPADAEARANWLPAPEGQFALIVRAYVPTRWRSLTASTSCRTWSGNDIDEL